MSEYKLQWHPAFQSALRIELAREAPYLDILPEYCLNRKPLQIDVLIRKKDGYSCQGKLARFFRGHNIIEYKNPNDYFSVNDFYKIMSYAGNYQAESGGVLSVHPEDITLTVICGRYPRAVLHHLRERFGVQIEKKYEGIYYIEKGLLFPLQIVLNQKLDPEEYIWLSRLRPDLKIEGDIDVLSRAYRGKEKDPLYEAVMEFIARVNQARYEEASGMCNALRELFAEEIKEAREKGISCGMSEGMAQGLSQGLAQGLSQGSIAGGIGSIRSMYRHRLTVENIAELIDQSKEYVAGIVSLITSYPAEDDLAIARRLLEEKR